MNLRVWAALVLLLNLVMMTACGGQAMPAPRPLATTDLSGINLTPYTDRWFGITGVLPEGWFQVDRGFFLAASPEEQPVAVHVQQVLGGLTLAQAQSYLLPWLSLEEFPEPVGQRESKSYSWHLYSYEHQIRGWGPGRTISPWPRRRMGFTWSCWRLRRMNTTCCTTRCFCPL